jgi:hypothetical protein
MIITTKYEWGQIVYLRTDMEQRKYIVTSIRATEGGIMYGLSHATLDSYHFESEISEDRDYSMA